MNRPARSAAALLLLLCFSAGAISQEAPSLNGMWSDPPETIEDTFCFFFCTDADPGFLECEPWGFAREIFAPHQLRIEQLADRVELLYGEWTVRRTIYLDGRKPPAGEGATPMGYSVGRYEGDALVIETTHIAANLAPWGFGFPLAFPFDGRHSDQLRAVERYTRSADGERLLMSATLTDPWALREPVTLKKAWAPDQDISPYEDCERPTEFQRGVSQP
jgi:hypothetical protein